MHIILDVTALATGHRLRGVGTYVRGLLAGILTLETSHRWTLIAHEPDALGALPSHVRIVRLPYPRLGRLTALATHQILLPVLLARLKADLVHFPGLAAHLSVTGLPWHVPLPFIVTIHDFTPFHVPELLHGNRLNGWWYARQRQWAAQAQCVICVSQATRDDAIRFLRVSLDRCPVVPEGVDGARFHPGDGTRSTSPYILFVGGNFPNKNRDVMLRAFAGICRDDSLPHRLVLVGPDDRADASLSAQYPGLDLSRVERLPQVATDQLAALYRGADLFVFPSRHEGFGLPVLEAMASGIPVITSTASSLPEVAGDAARLLDPDDVSGLSREIQTILNDRGVWQRLRDAGLARAQHFTWQETARRTVRIYESCVP